MQKYVFIVKNLTEETKSKLYDVFEYEGIDFEINLTNKSLMIPRNGDTIKRVKTLLLENGFQIL